MRHRIDFMRTTVHQCVPIKNICIRVSSKLVTVPNVGKQNMTEAEARAALIAARDTARKTGQPQTLEGNGAAVTAEPFVNRYGATVRVIYRVGSSQHSLVAALAALTDPANA